MRTPNSPLPLVTLTLTTDELAMASAALLLLLRHWNGLALTAGPGELEVIRKTMIRVTAFRQRLEDSVTEEQGRELLSELIRDLRRRP